MQEVITVAGIKQMFERVTIATPDGLAAGSQANPLYMTNVGGVSSSDAIIVPLNQLLFLGVAGAVTMSGIFLDVNGAQVGNSFTQSIPQATGSPTASQINGGTIPGGAIAAAVTISGSIYWAACAVAGGSIQTDFQTPATTVNYPLRLQGDGYIPLGRVF